MSAPSGRRQRLAFPKEPSPWAATEKAAVHSPSTSWTTARAAASALTPPEPTTVWTPVPREARASRASWETSRPVARPTVWTRMEGSSATRYRAISRASPSSTASVTPSVRMTRFTSSPGDRSRASRWSMAATTAVGRSVPSSP